VLRERWIREAKEEVLGRLWAAEDGRVAAGLGTPDGFGTLMLSDRAEQPVPERFPVGRAQVHALASKQLATAWQGQVWSSDLGAVADYAASLVEPEMIDAPRQSLFIARWVPAGPSDAAAGEILRHFQAGTGRALVSPESVQIGEDEEREEFVVRRNPSEPVAEAAVAGTLRIYAATAAGDRAQLELPLRAAPRAGTQGPFAFALDAARVHFLAGYVARKGRQCVIDAGSGVVRIYDQSMSRVSLLPALGASQVPARLRPLLTAAGTEAGASHPVPSAVVFERIEAMKLAREAEPFGLQPRAARLTPERVALEPIVWSPEGSSGRRVHDPASGWDGSAEEFVREWLRRLGREQALRAELLGLLPAFPGFGPDVAPRSSAAPKEQVEACEKRILELRQQIALVAPIADQMHLNQGIREGLRKVALTARATLNDDEEERSALSVAANPAERRADRPRAGRSR
jgi:hypothetical protein